MHRNDDARLAHALAPTHSVHELLKQIGDDELTKFAGFVVGHDTFLSPSNSVRLFSYTCPIAGLCAQAVGVKVRDSFDFLGKSRFSNVSIFDLLGPYANNTPRWYPKETDYTMPTFNLSKVSVLKLDTFYMRTLVHIGQHSCLARSTETLSIDVFYLRLSRDLRAPAFGPAGARMALIAKSETVLVNNRLCAVTQMMFLVKYMLLTLWSSHIRIVSGH
ncbi:unnamed protein product [Echinostoma caproni]|uniref:Nicastrin n=1 Tax=Echinostoma caproni TaxID=27848 RepID=A0A183B4V1_9TREM|nr:unnamed protein product [Echinostoma caproni]